MTIESETRIAGSSGDIGEPVPSQARQAASTAVQEASGVAHSAADAVKDVAHETAAQTSAVTNTAKEQFGTFVDRAKDELRTQADDKGQQAASKLRTMSDQLSTLLEGRPEEAGEIRGFVSDAQQRLRSYAETLQQRGPQGLVDDITQFARRRPGMFLALAGVGGFAVGRLVRAGAAANSEQSMQNRAIGNGHRPQQLPPPAVPTFGGDGAGTGLGSGMQTRSTGSTGSMGSTVSAP